MDPASLPDHVFLKIISYLNIPDRIRFQRLNHNWKRLSEFSLTKTAKIIDMFADKRYSKIGSKQLIPLFEKCSEFLRSISISFNICDLSNVFCCFACFKYPNLISITVKFGDDDEQRICGFCALIAVHCPSLKHMKISFEGTDVVTDQDDLIATIPTIMPNLLTLKLDCNCSTKTFDWLSINAPELRRLQIDLVDNEVIEKDAFDKFFQLHRELQHLCISCDKEMFNASQNFWILPHLTKLKLNNYDNVDDPLISRIVNAFPTLECFKFSASIQLTDEGVAMLAKLPKLRNLAFSDTRHNYNVGLAAVAKVGLLTKFQFTLYDLDTFDCVLDIIRFCQKLQYFTAIGCRAPVESYIKIIDHCSMYGASQNRLHILLRIRDQTQVNALKKVAGEKLGETRFTFDIAAITMRG